MTSVGELFIWFLNLLLFAIFGRVVISWLVIAGMRNQFLYRLDYALSVFTDPIMRPLRRVIPTFGMMDITPMVAIIVLYIVRAAIRSAI